MKLHTVFAAVLALAGAASASAVTLTNYGAYTLSYNELTSFTFTDLSFSGGGGSTGFGWNVDTSVSVTSFGAVTTAVFTLPNFTISVNPGWVLSGPVAGFLGNLVFNEVGAGAATSAATSGMVSVDGGPALPFGGALTKVATTVLPGYTGGYYVGNASAGIGRAAMLAMEIDVVARRSSRMGFMRPVAAELRRCWRTIPLSLRYGVWFMAP